MTRSTKLSLALAVAAALLLAVYWWASPYWEIRQMGEAARSHDGERFNAHVDYPRLRDSLRSQLSARLHASIDESAGSNPVAGLGRAMGSAMIDRVVDAMVRPEFVMMALREPVRVVEANPARPAPPPAPAGEPAAESPRWHYRREGPNRLIVQPAGAEPVPKALALVFERRGFAHWNLVELRLPAG